MALKNLSIIQLEQNQQSFSWKNPWSVAALSSLVLLVAGTLLFPDTFTSVGVYVGPVRLSPLGILLVLAAPPITIHVWKRRHSLTFQALDGFLLATMAYVAVRGIAAADTANGVGLVLAFTAYVLVLFYGTSVVSQDRSALRLIYISLSLLAVIIAAYAMIEFFMNRNILFGELIKEKALVKNPLLPRAASTLAHPVFLGAVMVQLLPFLFFFFFRARTAMMKLLMGTAIVLCASSLFVSYAKGAWATMIILVAGGVVWLIWRRPAVGKAGLVSMLTVTVIVIFSIYLFNSESVRFNVTSETRTQDSFDTRWYIWSKFPEIFSVDPVIGTGIWHNSDAILEKDIPLAGIPAFKDNPPVVDNMYLVMLVEQGIIGSLLAGVTLLLILREVWRLSRSNIYRMREWMLPAAVSIIAILINGLVFNPLLVWPCMVIFWLAAGVLRALNEAGDNDMTGKPAARKGMALTSNHQ